MRRRSPRSTRTHTLVPYTTLFRSGITGLMTYPSLPMAGFTAWAVGAHFAMASVRIDSRRGLGVNEQFMALAPTGYGKEEIRAPFEILARELQETARPTGVPSAWLAALPKIQHSPPDRKRVV